MGELGKPGPEATPLISKGSFLLGMIVGVIIGFFGCLGYLYLTL